jgi:hypothetical protein
MTQDEIADVLDANGFHAFADVIRAASGDVSLADGTAETRAARAIREARTQIERDYLPGLLQEEIAGQYRAALAALAMWGA